MTPEAVLELIRSHGGSVTIVDGQPRLRAPQPLPADVVAAAREHRAEIIELVSARQAAGRPSLTADGCLAHSVSSTTVAARWGQVENLIAGTSEDDRAAQWSSVSFCPCCAGPARAAELVCPNCAGADLAELAKAPPCRLCGEPGYTYAGDGSWRCAEHTGQAPVEEVA